MGATAGITESTKEADMAFAGQTVGEQRATAQLNNNLDTVGDMLAELNKSLKHFTEVMEANSKAIREATEAITRGRI